MALSRVIATLKHHPLGRGMVAYSIIWPSSTFVQELMSGKKLGLYWLFHCFTEIQSLLFYFIILGDVDLKRCLRYGIWGVCFIAPTLHCWFRLSSHMWPMMSIRTGIIKAAVEQVSYGPFSSIAFFFGMSLMESKTPKEAVQEVKDKFLPTYKVALCYWPIIQTINFSFIAEKNRLPFVSIASFVWTTFLAYMKQSEMKHVEIGNRIHEPNAEVSKNIAEVQWSSI